MTVIEQFVMCVTHTGHPAPLELGKVYEAVPALEVSELGLTRLIDEASEDYLYPADYFVAVMLPEEARRAFEFTT